MADLKISALTASTTPLAGTEVLPIVQSGVTKQVSVSNLTAGRAISATQLTLSTGNLIVASGQGIDFSATPGTGTSELFSDYEEGTWTPADASGAGLTLTVANARYTKIGRTVTLIASINYPSTVSTDAVLLSGLPFSSVEYGTAIPFQSSGVSFTLFSVGTQILARTPANANVTNIQLSSQFFNFSLVYTV